jgi:hypothetical protein
MIAAVDTRPQACGPSEYPVAVAKSFLIKRLRTTLTVGQHLHFPDVIATAYKVAIATGDASATVEWQDNPNAAWEIFHMTANAGAGGISDNAERIEIRDNDGSAYPLIGALYVGQGKINWSPPGASKQQP